MDGSSFGGIYDAFGSFERQMEEGLADIFDEDDPPSVAVAASATQSFQSIIGCAWQKYLIEKCHLSKEHVTNAMQIGMLDLLCIIPIGEVEEYGIPYLRSILEKNASKIDLEKWQTFWTYFLRQWLPILVRWNISQMESTDDTSYDLVNRTNNGLEQYNCHFNGLFNKSKRPSLLKFVQIVEKESRFQDLNSSTLDTEGGRR